MSREGDRLHIRTRHGDARVERTPQGISVQMPSPQAQLTQGQARQLARAIHALADGGSQQSQSQGQQGQGQGQGQQSGGFQQQGGQSSGWSNT